MSGNLRHRVRFQDPPATKGTRGQRSDPYTDVDHGTTDGNVSAEVTRLKGRELEIVRQVHHQAEYQVRIRPPKTTWAVDVKQRISWNGNTLAINDVALDSENEIGEMLILVCQKVE